MNYIKIGKFYLNTEIIQGYTFNYYDDEDSEFIVLLSSGEFLHFTVPEEIDTLEKCIDYYGIKI